MEEHGSSFFSSIYESNLCLSLVCREESLTVLNQKLNEATWQRNRHKCVLIVIDAGVGKHSAHGSVLQPFTRELLTKRGYHFREKQNKFHVIVWHNGYESITLDKNMTSNRKKLYSDLALQNSDNQKHQTGKTKISNKNLNISKNEFPELTTNNNNQILKNISNNRQQKEQKEKKEESLISTPYYIKNPIRSKQILFNNTCIPLKTEKIKKGQSQSQRQNGRSRKVINDIINEVDQIDHIMKTSEKEYEISQMDEETQIALALSQSTSMEYSTQNLTVLDSDVDSSSSNASPLSSSSSPSSSSPSLNNDNRLICNIEDMDEDTQLSMILLQSQKEHEQEHEEFLSLINTTDNHHNHISNRNRNSNNNNNNNSNNDVNIKIPPSQNDLNDNNDNKITNNNGKRLVSKSNSQIQKDSTKKDMISSYDFDQWAQHLKNVKDESKNDKEILQKDILQKDARTETESILSRNNQQQWGQRADQYDDDIDTCSDQFWDMIEYNITWVGGWK